MAVFFPDLQTLQLYANVGQNLLIDQTHPYMNIAIEKYLIKWVGRDQINDLLNAAVPTPSQQALIDQIRPALANFGMYEYVPFGEVSIDGEGITRKENQNVKSAFLQQTERLREQFIENGFNYLETLLDFLEENSGDYPIWSGDPVSEENRQHFINTAAEFSKHYQLVRGRQTFAQLQTMLEYVERFNFLPLLGNDFYTELKTKILNKTAFTPAEEKLLSDYIRPALAPLTVAKALPNHWIQLTPKGVVFIEHDKDTNKQITSTALTEQMNAAIRDAELLGKKMIEGARDYMQSHLDDFPIYRDDPTVNPPEDETTDCCDPCNTNSKYDPNAGGIFSL